MSDRELLELAAKAAGYEWYGYGQRMNQRQWNPITDDGDALRLAVKLGISIHMGTYRVVCEVVPQEDDGNIVTKENCVSGPYAATRRAIVRAAAEIGKGMGSESPKLICPRCGVDRFKDKCPGPLHLCPVHGEAQ